MNLPNQNAIDVAQQILKSGIVDGIANAVSFENTPYLSPICCGCGGGSGCGCGGEKGGRPLTAPTFNCALARSWRYGREGRVSVQST